MCVCVCSGVSRSSRGASKAASVRCAASKGDWETTRRGIMEGFASLAAFFSFPAEVWANAVLSKRWEQVRCMIEICVGLNGDSGLQGSRH